MKIDVRVIYGKKELLPEENSWLESMTSIKTSFCQALHAKCYLNEKHALLTSMNLYEYSQVNNHEMGILVSREEDPELYDEIHEEARRILRASNEVRTAPSRATTAGTGPQNPAPKPPAARAPTARTQPTRPVRPTGQRTPPAPAANAPVEGFCIRCRASIPANPAQPYCRRCYGSWKRFGNREFLEKHCHICGTATRRLCSNPPAWPASENSRTLWNSPPADRPNLSPSPTRRKSENARAPSTPPGALHPRRNAHPGAAVAPMPAPPPESSAGEAAGETRLRGTEGPATGLPNRTVPGARNGSGDQCQNARPVRCRT